MLGNSSLRVYAFIKEYFEQFGYAPTMQEIADATGLRKSTVSYHLYRLDQAGVIRMRRRRQRGIVLNKER
ncbi:MAG: helix-turn-helix domain-containing protein [Anaerolinea sp.]|nr:helix-turn-helix domain-containing protein [Anaerolinea sp.]